ncbi:MAG: outer membrane protein transport protein [Deltaproteobacteria bacterium]|nr:outer membrane protein transport protein [Deltaproteobacteria bacterium]
MSVLAMLSVLPRVGQAGLYTGAFGPTYNVGPESAWMNPAGMSGVKSVAATIGVGGIIPVAKFETRVSEAGGDNGGNSGVASVLPSFYLVAPVFDRFRLGLSVFSPLGGPDGLGWDFGDNFAGRYGSQGLTFASTAIAPSVSWGVTDEWSIGGGASAQWLKVKYSSAINTPFPGDGKASINIDDWSVRYFLGTQYQVTPSTSFGIVYRSKWTPDLQGDLVVTGLPQSVPTERFEMDLVLPQEVEFGIQHALSKTWILGLTFDWENWDQFKNIVLDFAFQNGAVGSTTADINWRDTYSGGISITHIMGGGSTFIDLGLNYASSPVSDADRVIQLPVDDAWTVSFGVAHNASKNLTFSLGGAVVFNGDARVDQVTQGLQFSGEFDTNVDFVLGGSLQWRF